MHRTSHPLSSMAILMLRHTTTLLIAAILLAPLPLLAQGKGKDGDHASHKEAKGQPKGKAGDSADKAKDNARAKGQGRPEDKGPPEGKGRPDHASKHGGEGDGKPHGEEREQHAHEDARPAGDKHKHDDKERPASRGVGPALAQKLEAEERKHIKNNARIDRIEALAKEGANEELSVKAAALREKELRRHKKALARLQTQPADTAVPATAP